MLRKSFLSWPCHWQWPNTISCLNCYCTYCYCTNAFEKLIFFIATVTKENLITYSSSEVDRIFLIVVFQAPIQGLLKTTEGLKLILVCTGRDHEKTFRIFCHKLCRKRCVWNLNITKQSWAIPWTKMNHGHQWSAAGTKLHLFLQIQKMKCIQTASFGNVV